MKCGTPSTMAPEIYFQMHDHDLKYDYKCDIWSLGVVLHELIYNCHPFNNDLHRIKVTNPIRLIP